MTVQKKAKSKPKPVLNSNANQFLGELKKNYPDAHCELNFTNPYELLVATILSAQCTDKRVNMVTPQLFQSAPIPKDLAELPQTKLEDIIRSTGFFRAKAKNLLGMARIVCEQHKGNIPEDFEKLCSLPGVGRKTANVVMGNAFNIPSGVVVDTHVGRLAFRMGWLGKKFSKSPEAIERKLSELFSKEEWIFLSHFLIAHGRALCHARKPKCESCFLIDRCPRLGVR